MGHLKEAGIRSWLALEARNDQRPSTWLLWQGHVTRLCLAPLFMWKQIPLLYKDQQAAY